MTPGKMDIFPQQATGVGKLRAHNREAWLGGKDQDDVANPRSGFLLEGDVAHIERHLGTVLGRPARKGDAIRSMTSKIHIKHLDHLVLS